MAIKYRDECCGCAVPGYPCIGNACELRHHPVYICDNCEDEVSEGELYWVDDEQLCKYCAIERLEVVSV